MSYFHLLFILQNINREGLMWSKLSFYCCPVNVHTAYGGMIRDRSLVRICNMLFLGIAKVQCVDSQIVFSWTMAKLQISTYNKTTSAAKFNALYFITKIKRYFVNEEISKIDIKIVFHIYICMIFFYFNREFALQSQ